MTFTKTAALALAATALLLTGCSGDEEPAAGDSPATSSTPAGPDAGSPTESESESGPGGSAQVPVCELGASAVKARMPGATAEQKPEEGPKQGHCTWTVGSSTQQLTVNTGVPEDFEPIEEARKNTSGNSSVKYRKAPEFGPDAWIQEVSKLLTLEFKTAGLRVSLSGTQVDEADFLAIARAVYTDAAKIG